MKKRRPRYSPTLEKAMQDAVNQLRKNDYVTLEQLCQGAHVSRGTMKRALVVLRQRHPTAAVSYSGRERAWTLGNEKFQLALSYPDVRHLVALTAVADLLQQLSLPEIADSARGLLEQLGAKFSDRERGPAFHPEALRVVQHSTVVPKMRHFLSIVQQTRKGVLQIDYYSPWEDRAERYVVEPWQVALINGVLYLRGWARERGLREFRMATIKHVVVKEGARPTVKVPGVLWPHELGFGTDDDRPGDAELLFEGPVARWLRSSRWHPTQRDEWVASSSALRRWMRYRSCRELARFLAQYADGLVSVEPRELRDELIKHFARGLENLGTKREGHSP